MSRASGTRTVNANNDTELMRVIGRIEGKIDGMISQHATLHSEHKELKAMHTVLATKVQQLENRLYLYAGGVAVISPIAFMVLKPVIDKLVGSG